MILVVKSVTIVSLHPSLLDISIATTKPAEPLTIPHISPITSLQNDETLSLFWSILFAVLAPFTFLDAIAWKDCSSELWTATPIISNKTPNIINTSIIIIPTTMFTSFKMLCEPNVNSIVIKKANKVIVKIHL